MSNTVICRIGYCTLCALSQSPKINQTFLAYGSTSNAYKVLETERNGLIGFVPHLYKLTKTLGENCIVLKSCSLYECGVGKKWENDGYIYYVKDWIKEVWEVKTWNSLVLLKHNHFTKMYEV